MQDAPPHIKKYSYKYGYLKQPAERLLRAIQDNKAQFAFLEVGKNRIASGKKKGLCIALWTPVLIT